MKCVQLIQRGGEVAIHSAGSAAVSGADARQGILNSPGTARAVRSLWSSEALETTNVVMSLPPDAVYIKWLHLETSSEAELDSIARSTATRGAPFPAHEAVVDYRIISSSPTGSHTTYFVMLVAASSSAVDSLLDVAENAGLEPIAVDIGTAAALRSFSAQRGGADPLWGGQPRAHCIIGARGTTVAVVRDDALEFARTVPVGGNDFTRCVAEAAGVSWEEAERIKMRPDARLTEDGMMITSHNSGELRVPCANLLNHLSREIHRSLKYFSSQFAECSYLGMIGTMTLSGGGALLKGLDHYLQQYGTEVTGVTNPFAGLPVDADGGGVEQVIGSAAAYTTAVGLALGGYWDHIPH